ncbi:osmoprotectant ABC transporter substrate-binding protein [Paenibacillus elgii]|nr:osmoprotectant ABC transporter substrate-binding protein [Paenibacillus elgii]MCM3273713.1 osmoprotectant ABC transporter substrate-binding protein [Paenibacillus elgii]
MKKTMGLLLALTLTAGLFAGCSSKETIKIGSQSTSEQMIIANMIKLMMEDRKLQAEIVTGLGSTPVIVNAMKSNEIQISAVRYVGTDLTGTLGVKELPADSAAALAMVQKGIQEKFDQTWFPSYGFENTYVFTVRQDLADQWKLNKVSDVASHAKEMRLGTDNAWLERTLDGYPAFKKAYGLEFGKTSPMEIGLVYKAVSNKDVDIVLAYSTDARLKEYNLKTLEDDKKFFPPYQASPVVRNDTLKKHPEIKEIMDKLAGQIDTKTMTELNYQADVKKVEPEQVAKDFLKQKGLLKS